MTLRIREARIDSKARRPGGRYLPMAEPFPGFTSLIRNLTINDGKPRTKHALKEGTTQTISHPPRHTGRPVLVTCIRRPEKRDQLSEAIQNLTGTTISHYRVIAKIGSGGMGVVYRAKDARLNRHVALKFVLNHGLTNESLYDCMLREARAASALNHPNVCAVYEIGDFRGLPFLVMELLKGQTLKERIKRPLTLERFLNIAIQICDGLDAVHSRAIVHRDIKPSNIFITAGDHVKIFRFQSRGGFPHVDSGAAPHRRAQIMACSPSAQDILVATSVATKPAFHCALTTTHDRGLHGVGWLHGVRT